MAPGTTALTPNLAVRDGITICGYYDAQKDRPFSCSDGLWCCKSSWSAWWGCVDELHHGFFGCRNGDNPAPLRGDRMNCGGKDPYCNTLVLDGSMTTWTCEPTVAQFLLLSTPTDGQSDNPESIARTAPSTTSSKTAQIETPAPLPNGPLASTNSPYLTTSGIAAPTSTHQVPNTGNNNGGWDPSKIAGVTVGAVSGLLMAILTIWGWHKVARNNRKQFFLERRVKKKDEAEAAAAQNNNSGQPVVTPGGGGQHIYQYGNGDIHTGGGGHHVQSPNNNRIDGDFRYQTGSLDYMRRSGA